MTAKTPIYLEVGARRVFAGAVEWPGWCRSAKTEDDAVAVLFEYAPRYAAAMQRARIRFSEPRDLSAIDAVERVKGNATTDFGAPAVSPSTDDKPIASTELKRLTAILEASWAALDAAARSASSKPLRKGPRGGGRELDAIVTHVFEADTAYLTKLGGKFRKEEAANAVAEAKRLRRLIVDALSSRARGEPLPESSRVKTPWSPRYFIRRSAWHALDHAWEIEDRAEGA